MAEPNQIEVSTRLIEWRFRLVLALHLMIGQHHATQRSMNHALGSWIWFSIGLFMFWLSDDRAVQSWGVALSTFTGIWVVYFLWQAMDHHRKEWVYRDYADRLIENIRQYLIEDEEDQRSWLSIHERALRNLSGKSPASSMR